MMDVRGARAKVIAAGMALVLSAGVMAVATTARASQETSSSTDEAAVETAEGVISQTSNIDISAQQWAAKFPLEYASWWESIYPGTNQEQKGYT